jgi:hypothetical protein
MGEVVDKIVLQPVYLQGFLTEYENDEDAQQNDADQYAQDQYHHPGIGGKHLLLLQVEAQHGRTQATADFDIPVDIQEKGHHQGGDRKDKYQNGMK